MNKIKTGGVREIDNVLYIYFFLNAAYKKLFK